MFDIESFTNLVKENPTLPIIPMVYYEIVGDDWGYWMGSFRNAYIGEYAFYNDEYFFDDRDSFKEHYYDWHDDELCEKFNYEPFINEYSVEQGRYTEEQLKINNENEKLLDEYLDKVADEYFVKAIIVYIDLPEV